MTDLNALIERLSRATGPDRELDAAIAVAIKGGRIDWILDGITKETFPVRVYPDTTGVTARGELQAAVPRYTSSIDAAMTLVPEGWNWELSNNPPSAWMCESGYNPDTYNGETAQANARTPAIALTIAALSARTRTTRGKSGAEDDSIQKAGIDAEQSVTKPSPATGGDA